MIVDKEHIFKVLLVLTGILASAYVLSPFIPVILLAAVIALAMNPLIRKLRASKYFSRKSFIYLLVTGLFLIITVPFFTVIYKIYFLIVDLNLTGEGKKAALETIDRYKAQILEFIDPIFEQVALRRSVNIDTLMNDTAGQIFSGIISASTYIVTQIPDLLFSFAVFILTLFLLLRHTSWIAREFEGLGVLTDQDYQNVIRVLQETSYSSLFSNIITGILQSIIVCSGAAIFLEHADIFLIFIITFFCSFIPVIGAAPIAFILAVFAWAQSGAGATIGLIVVGGIAGIADNIFRVFLPKIVKDEMHPFIALMAIIGGIIVLGLPGLFLGPVIVGATIELLPKLIGPSSQSKGSAHNRL